MKKLLAVILTLAMVAAMALTAGAESVDYSNVKLGVILLHDENSTYDLNFLNGVKEAVANLGLEENQVIIKTRSLTVEEREALNQALVEKFDVDAEKLDAILKDRSYTAPQSDETEAAQGTLMTEETELTMEVVADTEISIETETENK